MDYELHGQGLTMRAGNYPALTVMNHFMMRKDMKNPTIPVAYGPSVEQKAFYVRGARRRRTKMAKMFGPPASATYTSGYYKRRPKNNGCQKKGRKSARHKR